MISFHTWHDRFRNAFSFNLCIASAQALARKHRKWVANVRAQPLETARRKTLQAGACLAKWPRAFEGKQCLAQFESEISRGAPQLARVAERPCRA